MQFQPFLVAIFEFYSWILIARIILTWFPNINWYEQPFAAIASITDPVLQPFRGFLTLGMIDFSPIIVFIILGFISRTIASLPPF